MKVGTDGVLLGAWATVSPDDLRALDVGTGTGLIALMLAQRSAALVSTPAAEMGILGIDIDPAAAGEAAANFAASPWADRLTALPVSLQSFTGGPFDLIISNPPFFAADVAAPDARRSAARQCGSLPPSELLAAARLLLSPSGRLAVIYPPEEAAAFRLEAESAGLYLSRQTRVITTSDQPPKRLLMEFTRTPGLPVFDDLILDSPACRNLTADFYMD